MPEGVGGPLPGASGGAVTYVEQLVDLVERVGYTARHIEALQMLAAAGCPQEPAALCLLEAMRSGQDPRRAAAETISIMVYGYVRGRRPGPPTVSYLE